MTTKQTQKLLKKHKLDIDEFIGWMRGQTVGMKNGEIDFYEHDIKRYIDMKTKGIPTYFD